MGEQIHFFGDETTPNPGFLPTAPLAARMRPRSLDELVGQPALLSADSMIRRMVQRGRVPNLLLYGPPGTGKTTLAEVLALSVGGQCHRINAVTSNVAELREVLLRCRHRREGSQSLLFIDEIHRFNKSQQDLLLPDVEAGVVTLVGATTHNPGFYINPPLLSRCHLLRLEPLAPEEVAKVLERALLDESRGLGGLRLTWEAGVLGRLASFSGGDLRQSLNMLELIAEYVGQEGRIDTAVLEQFARERRIRYDAHEDEHYDHASAYIKSIRGCDPDAALYWMVKMLMGGEDPRFIARRLVIAASEDVGMADSRALSVAMAAFQACDVIGQPECEINLAHATVFLATCPKSNRAYEAYHAVKDHLQREGAQAVPSWLRDTHGAANRQAGHGKDYRYSHDYPEAISGQHFLLRPIEFYRPKEAGAEAAVMERLARWKSLREQRQ
jgi:putative ATPase